MYHLRKKDAARLLIVIAILLCTPFLVLGQRPESKLTQKVAVFDSESTSTVEQLVEVAKQFQIPMGIEWIDDPGEITAPPLHVRDATVQDVFRQILKQQRGYDFTVDDGIVHIFPSSIIDDPHNFLNIRFPEYGVKETSLSKASYWLRVDIDRLLHPSQNYGGGYGGTSLDKDFDQPIITFSGTNLTVRQILNNIVAIQGNALWVTRLRRSQMMVDEPFYAQVPSTKTDEVSSDFAWKFIALKDINAGTP